MNVGERGGSKHWGLHAMMGIDFGYGSARETRGEVSGHRTWACLLIPQSHVNRDNVETLVLICEEDTYLPYICL